MGETFTPWKPDTVRHALEARYRPPRPGSQIPGDSTRRWEIAPDHPVVTGQTMSGRAARYGVSGPHLIQPGRSDTIERTDVKDAWRVRCCARSQPGAGRRDLAPTREPQITR